MFKAIDANDFATVVPASLTTVAALDASYSDLVSNSTVLSTDPIISTDCTRKYLTSSIDPASNACPTAPHNASCKMLELLTASAGKLAKVILTVDVIKSLPEGTGVGTTVGRGEGDGVGLFVGALVGNDVGNEVGWCVGSVDGRVLGSGEGLIDGEADGGSVGDGVGAKLVELTPIKFTPCRACMLPV